MSTDPCHSACNHDQKRDSARFIFLCFCSYGFNAADQALQAHTAGHLSSTKNVSRGLLECGGNLGRKIGLVLVHAFSHLDPQVGDKRERGRHLLAELLHDLLDLCAVGSGLKVKKTFFTRCAPITYGSEAGNSTSSNSPAPSTFLESSMTKGCSRRQTS